MYASAVDLQSKRLQTSIGIIFQLDKYVPDDERRKEMSPEQSRTGPNNFMYMFLADCPAYFLKVSFPCSIVAVFTRPIMCGNCLTTLLLALPRSIRQILYKIRGMWGELLSNVRSATEKDVAHRQNCGSFM